ncbi:gram-negative porin family protein [Paraburkholderia xenovorans LB400]|uniref:Outer membrane porin, OmpC family n=1 Tax=Paraburkholderia xenovorans (strain LB400) TaxID=266265 RepID=Q13FG9_PARXL|nr:porin [Paraburkholderia xenovorans]ABE37170.1 outer membrane porin, OmpC family [Paraburkholderia xenovorans LB400]AIP34945.1 gram-negative porin family protein [Paraburkholderia xenovorans LB400]
MKKKIFVTLAANSLGMVMLTSLPGVAWAQSSVTLYGIVDGGVEYLSGLAHGSLVHTESGYALPTRWGMKGVEDLGGGTKAFFRLESGASLMTGKIGNGSFFGRVAVVGFSNDAWGQFRMGNFGITELAQDAAFLADPQWELPYAIETLVRGRNWSQAGNGLEYTSPTIHGFTLKGQYDLGNSTHWNEGASGPNQMGEFTQGRSDGIQLSYEQGPAYLTVAYDEIRDGNGLFDNVYLNSRSLMAAGTYQLGAVKLYAGYQHLSAPDSTSASVFGSGVNPVLPSGATVPTSAEQEWLGAQWQVDPANSLTAGIYHANANHGNGNATLYTLGATHNLSKATFLYAEAGYVSNSKTSNIGLGDGFTDPYGPNGNDDPASGGSSTAPNYGRGQQGVFAGIVHKF